MGRGKVVQVAKAETELSATSPLELLATLCYFYPQYTLAAARKLPYKHVALLLKVAKRQRAIEHYTMTQIVAAPHSKKGQAVRQLTDQFKSIIKSND